MIGAGFVFQFLIGGIIGTMFAASVVTSAWCFDSLSLAVPARPDRAKSTGAARRRIYITKDRRIRHEGYGLDVWEIPVEPKGEKGEALRR